MHWSSLKIFPWWVGGREEISDPDIPVHRIYGICLKIGHFSIKHNLFLRKLALGRKHWTTVDNLFAKSTKVRHLIFIETDMIFILASTLVVFLL